MFDDVIGLVMLTWLVNWLTHFLHGFVVSAHDVRTSFLELVVTFAMLADCQQCLVSRSSLGPGLG